MKTDRLPLLILALADIAGLVYAVYGFARAGTFVLTFLAERVSEAAASFSFDDFGLSSLFLITPLSSLLLYCLLPVSAYGLARGRTWVKMGGAGAVAAAPAGHLAHRSRGRNRPRRTACRPAARTLADRCGTCFAGTGRNGESRMGVLPCTAAEMIFSDGLIPLRPSETASRIS